MAEEEVVACLLKSVVSSLEQWSGALRDDGGLVGYALVTDVDMMSICAFGSTRRDVELAECEGFAFDVFDWSLQSGAPLFDRVCEMILGKVCDGLSYEEKVRCFVEVLVRVLDKARAEAVFEGDVVLLVVCADGEGVWAAAEEDAVAKLNSSSVLAEWRRVMG